MLPIAALLKQCRAVGPSPLLRLPSGLARAVGYWAGWAANFMADLKGMVMMPIRSTWFRAVVALVLGAGALVASGSSSVAAGNEQHDGPAADATMAQLAAGRIVASDAASSVLPPVAWARQLGGPFDDQGSGIAVDTAGNIYSAGWTEVNPVGRDVFVWKLDATGAPAWTARAGSEAGIDQGWSVAVDSASNVYTSGNFGGILGDAVDFDPGPGEYNLTSAGQFDGFVWKLNEAGELVWVAQLGGTGNEIAQALAVDADDDVIVTGRFTGTADFDPGPGVANLRATGSENAFVVKLNAAGELVWVVQLAGTSIVTNSVAVDDARNVVVTGSFLGTVDVDPGPGVFNLTSVGRSDGFVLKLSSIGELVWVAQLGGAGSDWVDSVAVDAAGDVFSAGSFELSADFDPGAGRATLSSVGGRDAFVSKLSSAGEYVWAAGVGGPSNDAGFGVAVGGDGKVRVVGQFQEAADFDPGPDMVPLVSAGRLDGFIWTLDSAGQLASAAPVGGTGRDRVTQVTVDVTGQVHSTGGFSETVDFDPGPDVLPLTSAGGIDAFVLRGDGVPTCRGRIATIIGEGYETLVGTPGDDVIVGSELSQTIFAGDGDDIVCAMGGRDTVYGGPGDDWIDGGLGQDALYGERGADRLFGGPYNYADQLFGGSGNDFLDGRGGRDTVLGGTGNDHALTRDGAADTVDLGAGALDRARHDALDTVSGVELIQP